MVVVNLDDEARVHEFCPDRFDAQRSVNEKHRPIRRLRSGWLLRSH
jgi:hypothetical protein